MSTLKGWTRQNGTYTIAGIRLQMRTTTYAQQSGRIDESIIN